MIKTISAVLALTFSTSALAYLDPGTGSMILQGLIAGIAISWFAIKTYWYKLGSIFGKNKPSSLGEEEEEDSISDRDQDK
jgi:hypothetical protein